MLNGPDDPRHGTTTGYTYHRCRCDACREAATEAMRRMRADPERNHPSAKATSYAINQAVLWVKANHPEVWHRFREEGIAKHGVAQVGWPAQRRNRERAQ